MAYGTPGGYGAMGGYYAPPSVGTNGLAIASLVCSLVGPFTCGLTTIVGVILGHVALSQIKRSGQEGRAMAIAGLVIGYLSLVAAVLLVVLAVVGAGGNAD